MLKKSLQKQLLDALKTQDSISPEEYKQYLKMIKANPEKFSKLLNGSAIANTEVIAKIKGQILNMPYEFLEGKKIKEEALKVIPQDLSRNYKVIVFNKEGNNLDVGLVDPSDFKAIDAIEFLARKKNLKVKYFVISPDSFQNAAKGYESIKEQVGKALDFAEEKLAPKSGTSISDATPLEQVVKSAPVSKIVSVILRHAIEGGASDIHIEPQGDKSRVRYRIDGILHTSIVLPIYVHAALVSRIKVISNLKIDETRIPQDGRIRLTVGEKDVDFRVSLIPLITQEKVVLRVLESPDKAPTFEELGFFGNALEKMEKNLKKPNGMFLVTGPTGSGKSTTLFSALFKLNKDGVNISTLEDPVEYHIEGINQSQVRSELGFSFVAGLRALLRQDPDIIMGGEIRDKETARLAIHAALTGHSVLTTLHTNDAVGAVPRFIDMGAEAFLLASTLNLIISQRLIRRICENCKVKEEVPPEVLVEVKKDLAELPEKAWYKGVKENSNFQFHKGEGCSQCGGTGYKGRLAIAEMIIINTRMREIIAQGFNGKEVREELIKQNFVNIIQDGWMKAILGLTTVEEILRVTKQEE
ncbi:type II/IV secretion system protein [bacterium]|nr:type II/IV secretion system protein [bacterium]